MEYPVFYFYVNKRTLAKPMVYVRIRYQGTEDRKSTKIKVGPRMWDQDKQKFISRDAVSAGYNNQLVKLHAKLIQAFDALVSSEEAFTAKDIYKFAMGGGKRPVLSWGDIFSKYLEHKDLEQATVKVYNAANSLFIQYIEQTFGNYKESPSNLPVVLIKKFNVLDFLSFLKKATYEPLLPTSRQEYMNKIIAVINWGYTQELVTGKNPTENFDFSQLNKEIQQYLKSKDSRILSHTDLETIFSNQVIISQHAGKEFLHHSIMLFRWQTQTGMSAVDMYNWFKENKSHTVNIDGVRFGEYNRQKTGVSAQFIWFNEIGANSFSINFSKVFDQFNHFDDFYSNYRNALKKIGMLMLNKELFSHDGRHTFGNIMIDKGYSLEAVSRMMGHASIKETEKTYVNFNINNILKERQKVSA